MALPTSSRDGKQLPTIWSKPVIVHTATQSLLNVAARLGSRWEDTVSISHTRKCIHCQCNYQCNNLLGLSLSTQPRSNPSTVMFSTRNRKLELITSNDFHNWWRICARQWSNGTVATQQPPRAQTPRTPPASASEFGSSAYFHNFGSKEPNQRFWNPLHRWKTTYI
jgi:hypothetical protein